MKLNPSRSEASAKHHSVTAVRSSHSAAPCILTFMSSGLFFEIQEESGVSVEKLAESITSLPTAEAS